ncbi:hypothetical protein [Mycobacterium paragordonae]|uniref:Uncharacterized protein n=1 Tax=Mycobacterium paragordonae TaxID=1389713 RepID=A0A4V3AXK5_9MYCO|nr:hypothetical protein [Mycobacterium paragordonae]MDP7734027.1 hypothetical protein [Mycobacterium paragordonae]TDK97356.1 hypothetical protein EUA02_11465 [Mycobacterium paragordonae]TDK98980.1 hypothetical protein EI067_05700 [Mycobacterium paragordonae]TDL11025.1 hypothetical protein EUA05_02605 [Mycobacterium paragordonae]
MISMTVARLAIATVLICPVAGIVAGPAAAEPETTPCLTGEGNDPTDVIPAPDAPTTSCDSQKQACMSANVQIGIYGERYVPPDAVAQCMEAYRTCIASRSGG